MEEEMWNAEEEGNECVNKHSGHKKKVSSIGTFKYINLSDFGLIVLSHLNSSSHVSNSPQSVKLPSTANGYLELLMYFATRTYCSSRYIIQILKIITKQYIFSEVVKGLEGSEVVKKVFNTIFWATI